MIFILIRPPISCRPRDFQGQPEFLTEPEFIPEHDAVVHEQDGDGLVILCEPVGGTNEKGLGLSA